MRVSAESRQDYGAAVVGVSFDEAAVTGGASVAGGSVGGVVISTVGASVVGASVAGGVVTRVVTCGRRVDVAVVTCVDVESAVGALEPSPPR